jgi:glucosylceramidase
MTGFGASMTDSSAYALSQLPATARRSIMTDLFSRTDGIGL